MIIEGAGTQKSARTHHHATRPHMVMITNTVAMENGKMISDVLSDALDSIRDYQRDLPRRYVGEEYRDLERVKAEMEVLRHKMDSQTWYTRHETPIVPQDVMASMCKVIDYVYRDEKEAYEDNPDFYGEDAIFPHIKKFNEWVEQQECLATA